MRVPPTALQLLAVMQLTEDSIARPAGIPRSFHCDPPSVVESTADPVARHLVSLEHEIASRLATPLGTACGTQVSPPFVVSTMAAPGPMDEEPTAPQLSGSTHEIAVKLVTVDGMGSVDQVVPPFVVTMTLGESSSELKSLTAWHVETLTHETAVSSPTPGGIAVSAFQLVPASVVPMMAGLPKMPNPTAVQSEDVGHEIPFRPVTSEGIGLVLQA